VTPKSVATPAPVLVVKNATAVRTENVVVLQLGNRSVVINVMVMGAPTAPVVQRRAANVQEEMRARLAAPNETVLFYLTQITKFKIGFNLSR